MSQASTCYFHFETHPSIHIRFSPSFIFLALSTFPFLIAMILSCFFWCVCFSFSMYDMYSCVWFLSLSARVLSSISFLFRFRSLVRILYRFRHRRMPHWKCLHTYIQYLRHSLLMQSKQWKQ